MKTTIVIGRSMRVLLAAARLASALSRDTIQQLPEQAKREEGDYSLAALLGSLSADVSTVTVHTALERAHVSLRGVRAHMGVVLTNQAGAQSWPVTGASFILVHAKQEKPENGREVLRFFEWSFRNGAKMADELDYVPMPEAVVKQIQAAWKGVTDAQGKPLY